jgi:hypothetical protein
MNASHYDPNTGASYSYAAIWSCQHNEDGVGNWYFVLPNLIGYNEDGTCFQGIAIRLQHGVVIAWDTTSGGNIVLVVVPRTSLDYFCYYLFDARCFLLEELC